MPRAKTVKPAAAVDETPAAAPPQTGDEWLTTRLTKFVTEANEAYETAKAELLEHVAENPVQAFETRGLDMVRIQAGVQIAWRIQGWFDHAAECEESPLAMVARHMNRERERIMSGHFRGRSTCPMHNAIETGYAIGQVLLDYDCWVERAASIDAELASKTDREAELKTELAPGVTLADYEALRREHRTEQLRATAIDDVVVAFKAAGLKYLGQRKVDLIRMLVAKEFNGH